MSGIRIEFSEHKVVGGYNRITIGPDGQVLVAGGSADVTLSLRGTRGDKWRRDRDRLRPAQRHPDNPDVWQQYEQSRHGRNKLIAFFGNEAEFDGAGKKSPGFRARALIYAQPQPYPFLETP